MPARFTWYFLSSALLLSASQGFARIQYDSGVLQFESGQVELVKNIDGPSESQAMSLRVYPDFDGLKFYA